MKKISNFLGSQVVNLAAAKEEGIIINGIMDDKLRRINYYVLVNEDGFEDEEIYLPLLSIQEGRDTLYIISNKQVEQVDEKFIKCPLNARVFNTDGHIIGIVKDIEYNEKGYTKNIVCDTTNIAPEEIIIATSTLITIKGDKQIRAQRKKARPKVDVESMMNTVEHIKYNTSEQQEDFQNIEENVIETATDTKEPPRIISNYGFLLQRKVTKDILANDVGTIIAQDTIIDDEVVAKARKHGKLVELTINSR